MTSYRVYEGNRIVLCLFFAANLPVQIIWDTFSQNSSAQPHSQASSQRAKPYSALNNTLLHQVALLFGLM